MGRLSELFFAITLQCLDVVLRNVIFLCIHDVDSMLCVFHMQR